MQKVLSLLLAFVLLEAQSWALSGGPQYATSGAGFDVVGTYSGVLVPDNEVALNTNTTGNFNSIGIFSIGVPSVGVATGAFAFFGNAEVFNGTMVGIADPDTGAIDAVLDAPTTLRQGSVSGTGGTASSTFTGQALGSMQAEIVPNTSLYSTTASRVLGTAHLDVFAGDFNADLSVKVSATYDFIIDGFKQSSEVSTSSVTIGTNG